MKEQQEKRVALCYACDSRAVGKEHVPPKAVFPKYLRSSGNLITVPSCSKHNQDKHYIDEIGRFLLLMHYGGNQIANREFLNSNNRDYIVDTCHRMNLKVTPSIFKGQGTGKITIPEAYIEWLELIAKGLHYYKFNTLWEGKVRITIPVAIYDSLESAWLEEQLLRLVDKALNLKKCEWEGEIPSVFAYRWLDPGGIRCLQMRFYEGLPIVAVIPQILSPSPYY